MTVISIQESLLLSLACHLFATRIAANMLRNRFLFVGTGE